MQIPHNAIRPALKQVDPEAQKDDVPKAKEQTVAWSSVDRFNISIGLLYSLCVHAADSDLSCAFCVTRMKLLRCWQVSPCMPLASLWRAGLCSSLR